MRVLLTSSDSVTQMCLQEAAEDMACGFSVGPASTWLAKPQPLPSMAMPRRWWARPQRLGEDKTLGMEGLAQSWSPEQSSENCWLGPFIVYFKQNLSSRASVAGRFFFIPNSGKMVHLQENPVPIILAISAPQA